MNTFFGQDAGLRFGKAMLDSRDVRSHAFALCCTAGIPDGRDVISFHC